MSRTRAWILDLGEGLAAAVGRAELVQVVSGPELFAVPHTPLHCSRAMIWQRRVLPVMDLGQWLKGREVLRGSLYAGVLAYASPGSTDSSPQFAALLLSAIPLQRPIDDTAACSLPAQPAAWRDVAWSCFGEGDRVCPVLALSRVFSGALK